MKSKSTQSKVESLGFTEELLPPPPPTTIVPTGAGFRSFYEFSATEINWHSILLVEDLIVAAMMKSMLRSGNSVQAGAAYQALRDAIGEMVAQEPTLGGLLTDLLARKPGGSEDKKPMEPPPNP